jgi:hypothetical protein
MKPKPKAPKCPYCGKTMVIMTYEKAGMFEISCDTAKDWHGSFVRSTRALAIKAAARRGR